MPAALQIAPALIIAAVMLSSAIAKLRRPDDLRGWAELGVPEVLRRGWVLRVHPWAELALGIALATLGGVLGLLAALIAVLLLAAYTLLVGRTWSKTRRTGSDATCACFGAPAPVTGVTVLRNAWLLLIAAAAAATIWTTPLAGGALAAVLGADPGWLVALAAAAFTSGIIIWRRPDAADDDAVATTGAASAGIAEDLEYVRLRTPAVPVTFADGRVTNLRALATMRPVLLLSVSETCGACLRVIEQVPAWRRLLPELDVRLLIPQPPAESRFTELEHPQSLHDPDGYVRGSIADWRFPTAVLFGADGLLAGGPETGAIAIETFVGDIYETLHGERPPADSVPSGEATGP